MDIPFVEKDCTVNFQGRSFESGGAAVSDDYAIAYPDGKGNLNDWHGNKIGTYWVVSSRPAVFFGQHSWQGSRYFYMRGTIGARTYAFRGFGAGMIAKGKRMKNKK